MTSLQGKLALVTGAAGVLGFATAKRLSEEGMRVVLVDIDSERLEESCRQRARRPFLR